MAAQVVEDGVAAEAVLVEALLADLGGLDLPELVEAQTLGLLHPRSQRAQEVLGRHENLRQSANCAKCKLSSLNYPLGPFRVRHPCSKAQE